MDLTIKDVSNLLIMSEKEIISLVKKKEIPSQNIQDRLLFNKHQIVEWALGRNIPLNISSHVKMSEYHIESLSAMLDGNSFFYDCDFSEKSYIEEMVSLIDVEENIDKGIITQLLKSRESLMSTAIGNGISLPHPRVPLMVGRDKPLINFFFTRNPLNLKSLDDKPVHTIILLISQTIREHLSLLAHLSFLLSKEIFQSALKKRVDYAEILTLISTIESSRRK